MPLTCIGASLWGTFAMPQRLESVRDLDTLASPVDPHSASQQGDMCYAAFDVLAGILLVWSIAF
jgi:hypothetical protein